MSGILRATGVSATGGLDADVARELLLEIVEQARAQRLLSEEHFSVDGIRLRRIGGVGVGEEFPPQRRGRAAV